MQGAKLVKYLKCYPRPNRHVLILSIYHIFILKNPQKMPGMFLLKNHKPYISSEIIVEGNLC
jgi:hypothetical protein